MSDRVGLQLFAGLDAATEAALRESIARFGVLVPVVKDQAGRLLDGHHRSRLADELGVSYRVDVIPVADEDEAAEVVRTLNAVRRHLTRDEQREQARFLRERGHSLRAIAKATGSSEATVRRDVSTASDDAVPDRVVGLDGKSRPARRKTVVPARTAAEADAVLEALASIDELPASPVISTGRIDRIARQQAAGRARATNIAEKTADGEVEIRHGDFRECLAGLDGQVDAIITDPPYGADGLPLLSDLGALAARLLKPTGQLVVMVGQMHLAESMRRLSEHLAYRWVACYLTRSSGRNTRVHAVRVGSYWKPLLVYTHPGSEPPWLLVDLFESAAPDKEHHEWGQDDSGFSAVVDRFTAAGDLVVDPMVGGGTTAAACQRLGRRFVGCDIDAAAVTATRARVAA